MQKISIGACVLAFGGFLETNALKIQSKLQEAAEDHPKPHAGELAQRWYGYDHYGYDRTMPMVAAQTEQEYKSTAWNEPLRVTFENASHDQIELFWHDYSGNLVSYGQMGPGQTMLMYTYATHPWSANGSGDFNVDGDAVWVPVIGDNDRTIQINKDHSDFTCDRTVNWMNNGPAYSQISLTDGCGMHNGICDMNPVYAADGHTNNNEEAIAYCQEKCVERIDNGLYACEGFFFQKHNNGHEICGFYYESMSQGEKVWGGHQAGAICDLSEFSYELVTSGDCTGTALVETVDECKAAIKEVFGVDNAEVQEWNTSAYAKGCFKHNYGNPGSAQAQQAPTTWVFNLDGGPGTSGHCTGEPGYAACICRDEL